MKENKIFIDNFYQQFRIIDFSEADSHKSYDLITGFHPLMDSINAKRLLISEIFKALLLHDKVVIRTANLLQLIDAFGFEDLIILIKTNRFEFLDDQGMTLVIGTDIPNKYNLSEIRFANKDRAFAKSIEALEEELNDSKANSKKDIGILLLNAEKHNKYIDIESISEHTTKETQYDLNNLNVTNYLNINSTSTKDIERIDIYNILRLSNLNKTLIYSSILDIDNIVVDGAVKPILGVKLSPNLNISPSINLFDSFFKDIFQKKNIPDLAELYLNKIITIGDYIHIISSFGNKKFRDWIIEKDYNPIELEKDIISLYPKISNKYVKFIKWSLPNAIGLFFPSAGIVSSFTEGYIYDKLTKGWHPNLFLDDLLRKKIDIKIEAHIKEERVINIKRKLPNIGRNDPCPCGSNKKFKHCCGK